MATASELDEQMMRRAIRLAMDGRGRVEPNPMVGCVIVKDGRVIGEALHQNFGGPHAEPSALASCTEDPAGATAYVTLEPCCHTNKKTPPCTPRLIEAKIARVVVGCVDPNLDVNGKGLDLLRQAGIVVEANVLEDEAKQLLAPFIARVVYRRPYVTLKWAETADGKVAGPGGRRMQITNEKATRLVQQLRARSDAILVGINTVLADDPMLSARGIEDPRPLIRYVLDRSLRIRIESRLVQSARDVRLIIGCALDAIVTHRTRMEVLKSLGVKFFPVKTLSWAMEHMALQNVMHVVVEPGPTLARAFFDENLADRVWLFRSPKRLNDATAPAGAGVPADFVRTGEIDLGDDRLTEYLNPASPVSFSAQPSADFELARSGERVTPSPRLRGEGGGEG